MNKENQENYVDIDENPIPVLLVRQGVDQTWNPKACDDLDKWKKDHQVPHIIPLNMEQMKKVRRSRFRNKRKRNEKEEEKNNSNIISLPSIEKAKKSEKINVYKRKNTHINSIESIEDNSYLEFQDASDTLLALYSFRDKFPLSNILPIILQSQIYTIINNRTEVDKEVNSLQKSNKIRLFRIFGTEGELAMVFTSDFEEYVNNLVFDYISNNLKKTMETNNHISSSPLSKKVRLESPSQTIPSTSGSSDLENKDIIHSTNEFKIVQHFLKNLLSSCCEIFISKDKLISLFRPITIGDQEIKFLINFGLFTMKDANSYYFNIPNSGNFWTSCLKGRKEVLSLIQRHKFKELPLTELEGKKVHSSNLGIAFHIKDLIGLELIETLPSRNGTLIRLKNKD